MILTQDREMAVKLIAEALARGAALYKVCRELGITAGTYQRWTEGGGIKTDGRPNAVRPKPLNKLSEDERDEIVSVMPILQNKIQSAESFTVNFSGQ